MKILTGLILSRKNITDDEGIDLAANISKNKCLERLVKFKFIQYLGIRW
jgi:hypothetical protein